MPVNAVLNARVRVEIDTQLYARGERVRAREAKGGWGRRGFSSKYHQSDVVPLNLARVNQWFVRVCFSDEKSGERAMVKPGLSPTVNPLSSQGMHRDYHRWYSDRLNRDMGVAVYGNYGMPLLAFPTSAGDEWEQEGQGMIRTLSPYLEQGRIRIFCINSVNSDSFQNKGAHPFHRSWMQAQYDAYVANEVFPFIDSQCQTPGIAIATLGASLGAYHAANTLFKHPDHVKRCYALSGIYDMRDSMDGMYDDNFYFNNPVDYMANQNDPWFLHQYGSCDIRLVTGTGPWENSGPTYRMSEVLNSRGIGHHLDDWGPKGGHEWPYWHHQMWEYVGAHY